MAQQYRAAAAVPHARTNVSTMTTVDAIAVKATPPPDGADATATSLVKNVRDSNVIASSRAPPSTSFPMMPPMAGTSGTADSTAKPSTATHATAVPLAKTTRGRTHEKPITSATNAACSGVPTTSTARSTAAQWCT
jgi:hypothetical protein